MIRYTTIVVIICLFFSCKKEALKNTNWDHYLGDGESSHYSILDQIRLNNITELELAWEYSSEDVDPDDRSQIQCNPLVIDGTLYGTSARLKLFAIDAETGAHRWTMDPFEQEFGNFGMGVNRGLAWHSDSLGSRILYSAGSYVFAVDPLNGSLIESFGDSGKIDLHQGLGKDIHELFIVNNSPGIVYDDLIILGSRVSESTGAAPGHIRAFDVHSGEQKWIFHTIPHPGEFGYDTWPENAYLNSGGANVWAGFSIDRDRGIVYCPTGSASYDFYGGDRAGENLFANCILALNARTGERIWHYQTIHHDIWDRDIPSTPNLVRIKKEGKNRDAVAQITKNGLLFVLDRNTGEPLFSIDEVSAPKSQLEGEESWPTQPVPSRFPTFTRTTITEDDLAVRNEEARIFAKAIWESTNHESMFSPPSERGTIIFPGYDGGGEWGGAAYDKKNNDLIINSNVMPWRNIMDRVVPMAPGQQTYNTLCQNCHGKNFEGNQIYGNVPALQNLKNRMSVEETTALIRKGKGIMPGFQWIGEKQAKAVYDYINGDEDSNLVSNNSADWPYPYQMRGYEKLYAPDGYPMITPPWGELVSMNLNEAKINWRIPLGEHEELTKKGMSITGTENYGGPIVTAGGLIFIASTMDEKIRAFNAKSGKELWSYKLPAAGYATPSTYAINGRQYVVIACGGGKLNSKSGDKYLAFALPSK